MFRAHVGVWAAWLTAGCGRDPDGKNSDGAEATTDAATDTGAPTGATDTTSAGSGANVRIDGAEGSAPDPDSAEVRLCVAEGGAVVVAWSDARDGVNAVWARQSMDGGRSWAAPPVRFGTADAEARSPDLVCDGPRVYLAWVDLREGDHVNPDVYVAASSDGGASFGPETRATGDVLGEFTHLGPKLAAAAGRVHVAWYGDEHGAYDVSVATSADGGVSFRPAVRLGSDPPGAAWSAHPVVAADGEGRVHVAWEDRRTGEVDLYVASSTDGGESFGPDRRVDDGDGDSYSPALHAAPGGRLQVAWHDGRDGSAFEVYLAGSADGGDTFDPPARVSAGEPAGTFDAVLPQLGWSEGQLQVAFYGAQGGGYHVQHRRLADGAPAAAPLRVDGSPDVARARYPKLAIDGADVVLAWEDDRDAPTDAERDLYYAWSDDGGATFGASDLRIDSRPAGGPAPVDLAVALDGGHLLAAWSDARDGTLDVWFARLALGTSALGGR